MGLKDVVDKIGTPAALEQLAEECAELGKAALKMARKMRDENPTPVPLDLLSKNFNEEIADVMICVDALAQAGVASDEEIANVMARKSSRWGQRLGISRPVEVKKTTTCPRCHGSGMIPRKDIGPWVAEPCEKCDGTGEVEE